MPAEAPRPRESTRQQLRRAVGRPAHWRDKLGRLAVALRGWADARAVDRRLQHLHALGRLEAPLPAPSSEQSARSTCCASSRPLRRHP